MKILLLIIMFNSGNVTVISFDDASSCISAKNDIKDIIPENVGKTACVIKK